MNLISILRELDANKITFQDACKKLTEKCGADFLASAYLSCRMQRESLRGRLNAYEDAEQPKQLDRATIETLIEHAYLTDEISQGDAFVYLTRAGVLDDKARARLETLAAIKNKSAERAEYLEDPATAGRFCTVCGRYVNALKLSKRGICQYCSDEIRDAVTIQMTAKSGPYYKRWRTGMMAYAYELEDQEHEEEDAIQENKSLTGQDLLAYERRILAYDDDDDPATIWNDCGLAAEQAELDDDDEPQMDDDNADLTECSRYPGKCSDCNDYGCTERYEPYEGADNDPYPDHPF